MGYAETFEVEVADGYVGAKPHVRPHPKNTPKQYHICVIKGLIKTLAIRSDFNFRIFRI